MFRGAFTIWGRDMWVLRRSVFSELVAVIAYPITQHQRSVWASGAHR
jgi:lipooligosaccharide transport system permease protein